MQHSDDDLKWLQSVRHIEYENVEKFFPQRDDAQILELGSGTGYIYKKLKNRFRTVYGLEVTGSSYSAEENEIQMYDGENIPFPDNAFDLIISFHVLEHVKDLDYLLRECRRTLRSSGVMIHVLPSSTWRLLTTAFHYFGVLAYLIRNYNKARKVSGDILRTSPLSRVFPSRHGEMGNVITEQWYFSKAYWKSKFNQQDFKIRHVKGVGLVYWGHDFLRGALPLMFRRTISRFIGSSSNVFVIECRK